MKKLLIILLFLSRAAYSQDKLTPEMLFKFSRVSDPQVSSDGRTVIFNVRNFDVAANKGNSDIYSVPYSGGSAGRIAGGAEDESGAVWIANGKIAFMTDKEGGNQVWEMLADGSNKTKITSVEGGISAFGYSPAGNYIWYSADVKMDKKANEIYPDLPKVEARIIDNLMYRHWNAWHDYAYSHIFILPYSNGKVTGSAVDILNGERFDSPLPPFGGADQVDFSHDGKKIAYTCRKLHGTDLSVSTNSDIYVYDIESKKTENISSGMPGYDVNPAFSPDGKKMIWLSMEEAGYEADRNRLFIYDFVTKERKELLSNFDYSVDHAEWNSTGSMVYFTAGINATHQLFVFDLNPKAKKQLRQITDQQADITAFSMTTVANKPVIAATMMNISSPVEVYSVDAAGGAMKNISNVNASTLSGLKMGNVEKRMIKTTDGKDMLTWVIYPPDFDPAKKYPALLYCQGGPQSTVSQFFSYRWNFQLMAANGYIVVAPNRRGLPSFGEEWNDAIRGDWGGQAMKDLLSAIDNVSNEAFIDRQRLGCIGASFGGYSVYWLAGNHNKRFKAFIAHCGVFNLESEYGSTEEMWFPNADMEGPYWKKPRPKSYDLWSPHKFVQNWDTPMLVIHNEKDFRVPITQGMEAFTAAQLQKIPSRFLYFPDEGHWVTKPQNSILWQRVFYDWLDKYLK